jgi:hypothetical protein
MNVPLPMWHHGPVHLLEPAQGTEKMLRHGDVCFKQKTVTEFLAVEKQSVTNIHKKLKKVYSVNAVKRTISCWAL